MLAAPRTCIGQIDGAPRAPWWLRHTQIALAGSVLAVLAAPREQRHAIRPIHAEGIRPAPVREALEWFVRLMILATGALLLGSGLAANAGVLGSDAQRLGSRY